MFKPALLGLATAVLTVSAPAYAAPEGNITYKMKRGDTLIALANKHFLDENSVERVISPIASQGRGGEGGHCEPKGYGGR